VRVGPFETRAEAERAAETIRSLQLEALVFKP
jgi:cell division protein FtsN